MPDLILDSNLSPHDLHKILVSVVSFSKRSIIATGKVLRELKKDDNFKNAVGRGIDSWADYLRQPEISLSSGEANRLIQIYEELVLRLGYDEETISEIPVKNMHYLLPLVRKMEDRSESDELVADATLLSQKDFKEKIWEIKSKELGVDVSRTYEYLIMRKTLETNTMERVMDISSDQIKETFNIE